MLFTTEGSAVPRQENSRFKAYVDSVTIRLMNSEKALSTSTEVVARTWDGVAEQVVTQEVELIPGESTALIQLPRLAGGPHFIDVWLRQNGQILDWFTTYKEIIPAVKVASIDLSQTSLPIGGNVEGIIAVEGAISSGTRMEIEMMDSFDRLLAKTESSIGGSKVTVPFSFPFIQPVAIQHRIVATLVDEHGVIDRKEQ